MPDKSTSVEEFQDWLGDAGLYKPTYLNSSDADALARVVEKKGLRIDGYCPACGQGTVYKYFTAKKMLPHPEPIMSRVRTTTTTNRVEVFFREALADVTFHCARESYHTLRIIFSIAKDNENGYTITKIGQLPSKFDLVSADLRKYGKQSPTDSKELHAAAMCDSAGFHVAAFAYLRRVFERRLEIAHEATKKDPGWNESSYDPKQMRMEDRIAALRNHLPDFLVENRKIYSILSKGIHELTEEECSEAFSTIQVGITLILDEELERRERAAKLASVSNDLARLHEKHKT